MRLAVAVVGALVVSAVMGVNGRAGETSTPIDDATRSAYRLVGTVEGIPEATFAVFEDPHTKQQKSYRIGDVINGATIVEIKQQHVLIKRGEGLVIIHITGGSAVEEKPGEPASAQAEKIAPEQALARTLSKQIPPYSSAVQKTAVANEVVEHLTGRLQQYNEKSAKLAETTFGKGVRAADLGQDVAAGLGLGPNDVIVGISGMGIETPERLNQIIDVLGRAKVFNLTVVHDSNAQYLSYEKAAGP